MGCDIHIQIEYRSKSSTDKTWDALSSHPLPADRCYRLFAYLAGVRNSHGVSPIVWPRRGIPDDISLGTKLSEHRDNHSHTWLTPKEFEDALIMTRMSDDISYGVILAIVNYYLQQGLEVRILLSFDS